MNKKENLLLDLLVRFCIGLYIAGQILLIKFAIVRVKNYYQVPQNKIILLFINVMVNVIFLWNSKILVCTGLKKTKSFFL